MTKTMHYFVFEKMSERAKELNWSERKRTRDRGEISRTREGDRQIDR